MQVGARRAARAKIDPIEIDLNYSPRKRKSKGFDALEPRELRKIIDDVRARGWQIEVVADSDIETFGHLIDRMR